MKIVVDGMGGDNAPKSNVEGVVKAIKEYNVDIIITGDKDLLEKEFSNYEFDKSKLEIVHTTEVIENEDKPVKAIRCKKDSSMVVGLKLVKEGKAQAFISAGNNKRLNHPHTDIINLLENKKINITISKKERRTVCYKSDGYRITKI